MRPGPAGDAPFRAGCRENLRHGDHPHPRQLQAGELTGKGPRVTSRRLLDAWISGYGALVCSGRHGRRHDGTGSWIVWLWGRAIAGTSSRTPQTGFFVPPLLHHCVTFFLNWKTQILACCRRPSRARFASMGLREKRLEAQEKCYETWNGVTGLRRRWVRIQRRFPAWIHDWLRSGPGSRASLDHQPDLGDAGEGKSLVDPLNVPKLDCPISHRISAT